MKKRTISKHPIASLNVTQFLGALNDNVFKYLIVFLLISLLGIDKSPDILFWVGTVYVLPFLLFSSNAGILADRFSKQRLMVYLKVLEIVIMFCGVIAFMAQSVLGLYVLMFLLSLQSALFSPPKYSIIPELVSKDLISKANGIVTSATYFAIIIGTFLASFITQVSDKNFTLAGFVCLCIAICGWITSLFIPYVPPKGTKKKMTPFFISSIFRTLGAARQMPYLLLAIIGSAFFLFVGAFFQLNVIPFAVNSLGLTEVGGGYLFLICAIGIACGAQIAGRISRKQVEIGLSCCAGLALSFLLFILYLARSELMWVIPLLVLIGIVSGLFIVPFDAFVQTFSQGHNRGQVVAANNFLSFTGVLLAPVTLYLISGVFDLSASIGFVWVSLIVFCFTIFLTFSSSSLLLNFIARRIILPLWRVSIPKAPDSLTIQTASIKALIRLFASTPFFHLYIDASKTSFFTRLLACMRSVHIVHKPRAGKILAIYWHAEGQDAGWAKATLSGHTLKVL